MWVLWKEVALLIEGSGSNYGGSGFFCWAWIDFQGLDGKVF